MKFIYIIFLMIFWHSSTLIASPVTIQNVKVTKSSENKYNFSVTLLHNDEGWEHYADSWHLETINGVFIAKRTLHHPHDNEQPFTRSLSNVSIPKDTRTVVVLAGCSVEGINSQKFIVELP